MTYLSVQCETKGQSWHVSLLLPSVHLDAGAAGYNNNQYNNEHCKYRVLTGNVNRMKECIRLLHILLFLIFCYYTHEPVVCSVCRRSPAA